MNMAHVAFMFHCVICTSVIILTDILLRCCSHDTKYQAMSKILDGNHIDKVTTVHVDTDDFLKFKIMLTTIDRKLRSMSNSASCDLCSVLQKSFVCHERHGCSSIFNICFKCLGRHSSLSCTFPFFKVKNGFCWKCWLPTFEIFGIRFHSDKKEDLGVKCSNAANNFVKPLCMHFFYNRRIANVSCPSSDISQYQHWLFSNSSESSISGSGQMPNIFLLLESVLTFAE